ncbi:hypothetical protein CVV68_04575 [Arthrobacter livingstonensis]|uniref:S1 motif domain-containing protein n=1 Tax=Arthrobacter livingstonensis TaxID=670078 RepID=A0A2V5LMV4_9MICC|nr:hypothetical protein [Arthrobacter livingstonensis]PYI69070.1 hypothetical protein CVV68_04575 [Arthrobacter livingstonensis]
MPAQRKWRKPRTAAAPESAVNDAPVLHLPGATVAQRLADGERTLPAIVVSYKADAATQRIDAGTLARLLDGEADVFELQNGEETRNLQDGLPEGLEIYGTGGRAYPAGPGWAASTPEPRLVYPGTNVARLIEDLAADVRAAPLRMEPAAPAPPKAAGTTATGTVGSFAADDNSRALVRLATTGQLAYIRAEDLLPGVPLDWLLTRGQQVTGLLDEETHTLDIRALLQRPGSPVTVYGSGDVALARVKAARATHAVVTLWPDADFRIGIGHISSNELDAAEDLLTEGEVVRVRVLYENGAVVLSMLDVDDDDPHVPAPSLVAGGPPWLAPDRPYTSIFAPPAAPAAAGGTASGWPLGGTGGPEDGTSGEEAGVVLAAEGPALTASERRTALKSTQMELEAARHTIAELLADATRRGATDKIARIWQDRYDAERGKADLEARRHLDAVRQLEALKAELARTNAKLVDARQRRRSAASRSESAPAVLFTDPMEQFDLELRNEWARMVPAVDKAAEPLGVYMVGPHFLASLAQLPAPQRAKAMRAVVDLVADRSGPLRNRKPHVLRENEGAHAPARMRGDDACWRLYVEQGTAAALRLHYWKLKSGGFELHEVVPHDAVKP